MVSFLLENGADPSLKDKTGRTPLDIAKLLNREKIISILTQWKQVSENEWKKKYEDSLQERSKYIQKIEYLEDEILHLQDDIEELSNSNEDLRHFNHELLLNVEGLEKDLKMTIIENEKKIQKIEDSYRMKMLTDSIVIEENDLKFDLPLKKKNCFFVKNVKKAKELGGCTSFTDIETFVDNMDFKDVIEVRNTLSCLEDMVQAWREGKVSFKELDDDLKVEKDFNSWKTKDQTDLIDTIYSIHEEDKYEDFGIIKRIIEDFHKTKKTLKSVNVEEISKFIIKDCLSDWKNTNKYHDEVVKFIDLIKVDKTEIAKEMKKNFQWEMIPKWNDKRNKLKDIMKKGNISSVKASFEGLLITND